MDNEKNVDEEEEENEDEWISAEISEVIVNDEADEKEEEEWIPDREKARRKRERVASYQSQPPLETTKSQSKSKVGGMNNEQPSRVSPYTEEEEQVIDAMGGKAKTSSRKRESGFLGDSTLKEIAMDYSVPVCYLADVLCMWGVPVPININDRLGDLVTGEQAFAILEAVNSLDVAALNDRYSNQSLITVCNEWNIDVSEGFQMAMKEGWSLPFGVHTVLRVEQEEELLRVLGGYMA